MLKQISKTFYFAILIVSVVFLSSCSLPDPWNPEVADDEIGLDIQLDTKEDIGLLLVEYDIDGTTGAGGVGSADKSMLKRDDRLLYTFRPADGGEPGEKADFSVLFSVITVQTEPNMEDIYPPEYTVPLAPISRTGALGECYLIRITGDKANGYEAVWEE